MTCTICGERTIPGVVCCDILIDELNDEPTIIRGED